MADDAPNLENGSRLDRIERAVEFLATHAATVDGQISSLTDHFDRLFGVVQTVVMTQADAQRRNDERFLELADKFVGLSEKVETMAEKVETIAEKMETLADAQRQTEAHISTLVEVVDDIIRRPPPA